MTRREKRKSTPPMNLEDIQGLADKLQDPLIRKSFRADDWPIERNEHGFITGPLRQCMSSSGRLKQIYPSLQQAQEFEPKKYPYTCTFGHIHVSSRSWTRQIFNEQNLDYINDIIK